MKLIPDPKDVLAGHCLNCAQDASRHEWHAGKRFCLTTTFEPKPEPLRAKAGIRYRRQVGVATYDNAIGMADGTLTKEIVGSYFNKPIEMTPDWTELTQEQL